MRKRLVYVLGIAAFAVIATACSGGRAKTADAINEPWLQAEYAFQQAWFTKLSPSPDTKEVRRYFKTGNQLRDDLMKGDGPGEIFGKAMAMGYVIGVYDGLAAVDGEKRTLFLQATEAWRDLSQYPDPTNARSGLLWYLQVKSQAEAASRALNIRLNAAIDNPKGENVTVGQVVEIVKKYLADHPEELNLPAGVVVWRSLASLEKAKNLQELAQ